MLVRTEVPQLGFWKELGQGVKFVANVATAPIRLPVEMVKAVASGGAQIIGATTGLVTGTVGAVAAAPGQILGGLRPAPAKPDPGLVAALTGGGAGGRSSLAVPLIAAGGIVALGVVVFLVARKKRGGS